MWAGTSQYVDDSVQTLIASGQFLLAGSQLNSTSSSEFGSYIAVLLCIFSFIIGIDLMLYN